MSCVLDGEIVCLAPDGRSKFYDLMFCGGGPTSSRSTCSRSTAKDLRDRPLLDRKRRLRGLMPRMASRLLYHDPCGRPRRPSLMPCAAQDLEGIVAKWKHGLGKAKTEQAGLFGETEE